MTLSRPQFSIVTAVYNVEPYLPEFIASIEAQRFDLGRIEVIAVDDGSTDGSLALLEAWAARRPELVTVLTKANGGQASARNLGLEHASGEWVTFTDPDDILDRDFFRVADRFAARHPDIEVMAGNPIHLKEREGRQTDTHPRRAQYDAGDRPVDLEREPNTFASSTVSLYRLDRIRAQDLRFDTRIRPRFEDGHFAVCFLLGLDGPRIGLLHDARYIYRRRSAGDSSTQRSHSDPGRYTDVLEFGLLDVIHRARRADGSIPAWVQHVIIYEVTRYFAADETITTSVHISPELIPTFHDLLASVVVHLDPAVIRAHRARKMKATWADILAHGCRSASWHSTMAARTKVDTRAGLQRVSYRYAGTPPREDILIDGAAAQPVYGKTMAHTYYGRALLWERIVWLPIGRLQLRLDDEPVSITSGWPVPGAFTSPTAASGWFSLLQATPPRRLVKAVTRRATSGWSRLVASPVRLLARLPPARRRFRDAWVLMDRIYDADDNAERLFEYLGAERPDINAWFVLEKDAPDWKRLRAAGVRRLVAHGSLRWKLLMLNCTWLLSSHGTRAVAAPPSVMRLIGEPTWQFAFLQHGVIKDDLSTWLNPHDIDLFVVSTVDELESVVADDTNYRYTARETRNTGLPRFDRLLAKGRSVAPEERNLVLIAPTWRMWLTDTPDVLTHRRAVDDRFWESDYLQNWTAVLRSPEVAAAAATRGWRIAFMPHPNMQPILPQVALPAHVEPLTFAGNDVQALYARCALLVTDYSSVAFNAAYLDRPVVYFQFDLDQVMGGAHLGRKGYFEYERDGFGPVVTEPAAAVSAIVAAIAYGPRPTPAYQARIDRTFVNRDGQACARVVAAVEELSGPDPGLRATDQ